MEQEIIIADLTEAKKNLEKSLLDRNGFKKAMIAIDNAIEFLEKK